MVSTKNLIIREAQAANAWSTLELAATARILYASRGTFNNSRTVPYTIREDGANLQLIFMVTLDTGPNVVAFKLEPLSERKLRVGGNLEISYTSIPDLAKEAFAKVPQAQPLLASLDTRSCVLAPALCSSR